MSVTDFTKLINVDVDVDVSVQMNQKERVISEFEMDFKKSLLSSSLNSTYTRSDAGLNGSKTGVGNNIFLVRNRVRILGTLRYPDIGVRVRVVYPYT